ncbi:ATP-binding protein [Rhodococcus sp. NPDC058521]|uniref:sensor histidine kinase n=1 Tax=Rhodococcus sp. NPDC058521 TaxID=3346536 RepID=UPI00364E7CA0
MSDDSPPRTKLWDIEGWGLRWKVTAVLAVPVTVAMVLGGLRVQNELNDAVHFTTAAEQVSSVPSMVSLEGALGTVVGSHASGTLTPNDRENLAKQFDQVAEAARNPDLPPEIAQSLDQALADGHALEGMTTGAPGSAPIEVLAERQRDFSNSLSVIADNIVAPIDDRDVLNKYSLLVDAWAAQRRIFDQSVVMIQIREDFRTPTTGVITAAGAELALIDVLARSFPDDNTQIQQLRDGTAKRTALVEQGVRDLEAEGKPLPILQLRTSLLESLEVYTDVIGTASADIVNTVDTRAAETRSAALRDTAIVLGTLLAALVLALLVARSLIGPVRRLRFGALQVARRDLPDAIDKIKSTDDAADVTFTPVEVHSREEIGQLARAIDDIHGQALKLAGEQAHLRLQINDMFETLARRSKSLIDQQLGLIEHLEFEEKDPKRLESLFRLDHLAARMRRNGENLLILAGTRVRRGQSRPIALGDVLRAAMSEVEDYQRVQMGATPDGSLSGAIVTDVVHLLAELVDNALRASPPDSHVNFSFARAVDGGVLLEIADRGIGIPPNEMDAINQRLSTGGEVGPDTARHMGLFVVSRLADRHGLTVRMRSTFDTARNPGVTVSIHIPSSLIITGSGGRGQLDSGAQRAIPSPRPDTAQPAQTAEPVQQAHSVQQAPVRPVNPSPQTDRSGDQSRALPQRREAVPNGTPSLPQRRAVAPEQGQNAPAQNAPERTEQAGQQVPSTTTAGLPKRRPGASGIADGSAATPSVSPVNGSDGPRPMPKLPTRRAPAEAVPTEQPREQPSAPSAQSDPEQPPLPTRRPAPPRPPTPAPESDNNGASPVRHRYRTNPAKTASFFQSRIDPPPAPNGEGGGTPIFADMVSDWLTDPTGEDGAPGVWESAADKGWSAAERVASAPVEVDPEIGLPKRRPGDRLVPGTVEGAHNTGTLRRVRDPETIRANLSRHQQGVRNGRATRVAERNSIEGDR